MRKASPTLEITPEIVPTLHLPWVHTLADTHHSMTTIIHRRTLSHLHQRMITLPEKRRTQAVNIHQANTHHTILPTTHLHPVQHHSLALLITLSMPLERHHSKGTLLPMINMQKTHVTAVNVMADRDRKM